MAPIEFTLPLLGHLTFEGLALPAIILGGAIDSINPCAFGVLIFLMTYLTKVFDNRRTALIGGLLYTSAVYATYFLSGVGLMAALRDTNPLWFWGIAGVTFLTALAVKRRSRAAGFWFGGVGIFVVILALLASVPVQLASYAFYWVATFIAFMAAAFEIKDFFWYGKGVSMDMGIIPGASDRIKQWTSAMEEVSEDDPRTALFMTIPIGFGAAAFELPCTGQVYLAILGVINASGAGIMQWGPLLALYNFIFVLPLLIITGLMYLGMSSEKLEAWRKRNRKYMRLGIGTFLYLLGGFLLWFTYNQFGNQPTLRPLTFVLFASQVSIVGYIIYKGYVE